MLDFEHRYSGECRNPVKQGVATGDTISDWIPGQARNDGGGVRRNNDAGVRRNDGGGGRNDGTGVRRNDGRGASE